NGGTSQSGAWALSLAGTPTWLEIIPTNVLPFGIRFHSAIYDPVKDRMVVFGGAREGVVGTLGDDAWALSLSGPPTWSQLLPSGWAPSGRSQHTAIYDPVRDRMAVLGGFREGVYRNDTWLLSWNDPTRPGAACPGELVWTAGAPLQADYVLSNPLATKRTIEWTLESARQWPGFPLRGRENVGGGE